ncbi:MAG: hypothetical protein CVU54_13875 [Deltaproteobacteria bacterium HGW-Deltaproteobacteria-12]|jgi:hypothetical protein|nr:MAG: hypothetical protein CVU54_13875 [Deltaproteobacteria bacterium HGW-Deltaproteobacteria-12]
MKDILIKFLSLICAVAGIIGIKEAGLPTVITVILVLAIVFAMILVLAIDFTKKNSIKEEAA